MLLVPLATGAAVALRTGGRVAPVALLAIAALALFCLRTPLEVLVGASAFRVRGEDEIDRIVQALVGYTAVAGTALFFLFQRTEPAPLVWLAGAVGSLFLLQLGIRRRWPRRRGLAQCCGAAALSATAAAAHYVASGRWTATAGLLWALNWLFAVNQIEFVQLRIRTAKLASRRAKLSAGRSSALFNAGYLLVLLGSASVRLIDTWVVLAFVPVLARGIAWFFQHPAPLHVKRLGLTELAYAIAFGILLGVLF
jgi:hypothetical protein